MVIPPKHIAIVGGGIIGLSIGWQLLRRDVKVSLYERDTCGRHASRVAAGMLAPYAEVGFEDVELMKFGEESLRLYPRFLDELSEDCSTVPAFNRCGTLLVGIDRDDTEYLRRLYNFREELELTVKMMTGSKAREREPLLSPGVVSSIWLPDDGQIDNRHLLKSLKEAFLSCGGNLREHCEVAGVCSASGRCTGVVLGDEEDIEHDAVIMAAGPWIPEIDAPVNIPLRPIKGQILTLKQTEEYKLSTIIRSPRMYLVPKENNVLRLGATVEEQGFDTSVTAGGVKELLEDGWEAVPSIYDLPVEEMIAGLRPAGRDHAPIIGESAIEGLYYATGHFRDGILFAPATAYHLTDRILSGNLPSVLRSFQPGRFE